MTRNKRNRNDLKYIRAGKKKVESRREGGKDELQLQGLHADAGLGLYIAKSNPLFSSQKDKGLL